MLFVTLFHLAVCSGMIVVARSMTSTKLQVPKGGGQPVQEVHTLHSVPLSMSSAVLTTQGKKKFHPAQELYFDFLLEQVVTISSSVPFLCCTDGFFPAPSI